MEKIIKIVRAKLANANVTLTEIHFRRLLRRIKPMMREGRTVFYLILNSEIALLLEQGKASLRLCDS